MDSYYDQPSVDQIIEALRSAKNSKFAIEICRQDMHRASGVHPAAIDNCEDLAEALITALQAVHADFRKTRPNV